MSKSSDKSPILNIGLEIRYTMRAFTRALTHVAARYGLTSAEFRVLRSLEQTSVITQAEIAEVTAMERPHVSTLIKRLRDKQLVVSSLHGTDRRRSTLELTKDGHVVCSRIAAKLDIINNDAISNIPLEDLGRFLDTLSKVRFNLEQNE